MAGDTISFARGAPSADILPHEQVREAAARALASDWETALSYGVGIGHPGLCQWVAERHGHLDAAQVMIANGSLEAGAMLFEHLLGPGDRVVVEQPTYDRTLLLLQQIGVELVPVRAGGRRARRRRSWKRRSTRGRSSSPTSSPTPTTPPAARSPRRSAGAWSRSPPSTTSGSSRTTPTASCPSRASRWRRCSRSTRRGKVVHASSFSKTVSPGVRVGYLAGPAEEIKKLAKKANETYISPNMLAEAIVLELCRSGELDRNIEFVKGELKARCDALVAALREQIPEAEFVVPEGGYFLWLDLAEGTDTAALLAEAKGDGVSFVAGPDFMIAGGENSLRLSFAPVPADRAAEGVSRIAGALERLRA